MNHRQREKRARRQQGAIFVEALVVSMMLIACIGFIWAAVQLVSAQHRAISAARSYAWIHALNGCGDDDLKAAWDDLYGRSSEPADVCEGEDCGDGEHVADLKQGNDPNATLPDWFSVDPGPEGQSSQTVTNGLFRGSNVGASRQFSCNPRRNRQLLSLGDMHQKIMDSAKGIFKEAAPPPYWEGQFSDEAPNNHSSCREGGFVNGWKCLGPNCDDSVLRCEDADLKPAWTSAEFTVNSCNNTAKNVLFWVTNLMDPVCTGPLSGTKVDSDICPPDSFVTDVRCQHAQCATLSFTCTAFEGVTATDCAWTADTLSEEQEKHLVDEGKGIAGIECSGRNCDNKRFYVCTVSNM